MGRKKKELTKPIGRFLRWSALFLFCYLFIMNAHIRIEMNRPSGIQEMADRVSFVGKIVKFIRNF